MLNFTTWQYISNWKRVLFLKYRYKKQKHAQLINSNEMFYRTNQGVTLHKINEKELEIKHIFDSLI